ncbi:conserved unknown protein [Ectocarpus siliculosus]|uniref:Uncharacterized protein n=1 Tax=Ectocarpus siliculosus TaxID=2880 RepID=D8LJE8_ECTSI|nr:conserved unknown protein [Ectocarpus siliculosus]|eukprot:CBN79481.1 conserved unknown protein [Ectocarpus siliculosus]
MSPQRACRLLATFMGTAGMASAFLGTPVALSSAASRPTVASSSVRARGRCAPGAVSVSMGLVDAVPDKLKNVFASKPKPTSRRGRTEGAELYRTLGVTPDADYLEVMEACDRLKVKYASDRKQVIRVDKAKDGILSLRLNQAVKGNIKTNEEAQNMDSYLTAKEAYIKQRDSPWQRPTWAKGWVKVPDKVHGKRCATRHGLMALFVLAFPSAGMGVKLIGGMTTFGMTMNRDGPELKRDDNGQVAEVRLPSKLSSAMSFLAVIGSIFVGSAVGGTFSQYIGNRILIRDTWMDLSVAVFPGDGVGVRHNMAGPLFRAFCRQKAGQAGRRWWRLI